MTHCCAQTAHFLLFPNGLAVVDSWLAVRDRTQTCFFNFRITEESSGCTSASEKHEPLAHCRRFRKRKGGEQETPPTAESAAAIPDKIFGRHVSIEVHCGHQTLCAKVRCCDPSHGCSKFKSHDSSGDSTTNRYYVQYLKTWQFRVFTMPAAEDFLGCRPRSKSRNTETLRSTGFRTFVMECV